MRQQLVFDLDDTLFPESDFVRSGFRAVDQWISEKYSTSGFFDIAWSFFVSGKREKIFDLTIENLNIKNTTDLIKDLLTTYREHKPTISLFEDAEWAINYFGSRQDLGLITDGYLVTQENKVEALGIKPFFKTIIFSDAYGSQNWKPSPFPYLKAMELMNCPGENCVYVGDNPKKDFVSAKELGWVTVQIYREGTEYANFTHEASHKADFKIESLIELKTLFSSL
jgi:putative hydrolase of the HAD superfamily